jgi:glycosyltransferase involved in cell wall biosynthesis
MSNKTRVLFCGTHAAQNNGYSKVVYEISKRLAEYKEIDLHVFGFQKFHHDAQHDEERKLPSNVTIFDVYGAEKANNINGSGFGDDLIGEYVKEFKPHMVIVYNDLIVLYRLIKKLIELPEEYRTFKIVPYIDLVYKNEKNALIKFLEDTTHGGIMFAQYWKEVIQSQGYTKALHVVNHGFDKMNYFPVPKEIARNYFSLEQNDFIILNLNRNQPRKRWDHCMQAFIKFISTHQNDPIKLLVGTAIQGSWDLIDIFISECRKYGLDPEETKKHLIIMNNPQKLTDKDVNILYNCADIGINTGEGEGWGLCNFEHGAIGIPQIVPNVGGFKDFFSIENSFIVSPKWSYYSDMSRDIVSGEAEICDVDDYVKMMEHAYNNRELLSKFGQKARTQILEKYKWEDKAKAFYDCIIYHTKDMDKTTESLIGKNKSSEMKLDMFKSLPSSPPVNKPSVEKTKEPNLVEAQNKIFLKNVEVYDANEESEEEPKPQKVETMNSKTSGNEEIDIDTLPNKEDKQNISKNLELFNKNSLLSIKHTSDSGPLNISSNRKTNTPQLDVIKEEPVNKKESIVMDLPIMKKIPVVKEEPVFVKEGPVVIKEEPVVVKEEPTIKIIKEMREVDEGKVEQVSDRDLELDGVEESKEKPMSDEMKKLLEMQNQLNLMIQSMMNK